MENDDSQRDDVLVVLKEKRTNALAWRDKCAKATHIAGMTKLIRKMQAELDFLNNLEKQSGIKEEQVRSSNVTHLQAIAHSALTVSGIVAVLQPMLFCDTSKKKRKILIDVVGNHGNAWIKVVARNKQSLDQICMGKGHFGERTILDHAHDYVECSRQNLNYYTVPGVQFHFYKGVTREMQEKLEKENVLIKQWDETSLRFPNAFSAIDATFPSTEVLHKSRITELNLDVSCMIAYVSALTNGSCNFKFKQDVLTDQALRERRNPVKPQLDAWFEDRKLICCETAVSDFTKIVDTIGGRQERERARDLLKRLTVVKDRTSSFLRDLGVGGQIKKRSLVIFGTGEELKAVTVTANAGFVRAAQSRGIFITSLVHESRALSEVKEETAKRI